MTVENVKLLMLTDPDEAFEMLGEQAGYFGDSGGEPDGDRWLQRLDMFDPATVEALVNAGVAEVIDGYEVEYIYTEERDYEDWCGYSGDFVAFFLDEAEAMRFHARQVEEQLKNSLLPDVSLVVFMRIACHYDHRKGMVWETAAISSEHITYGGNSIQEVMWEAADRLKPYLVEIYRDGISFSCVENVQGYPASEEEKEKWERGEIPLLHVEYRALVIEQRPVRVTSKDFHLDVHTITIRG